ncbi:hypothetical protein FGO68_gene12506 [Halteria grandinella]|uniref:Uncharacterized protein n=1 Tax=Halteria grandinella TaxID=5974 RepID=A0A8J8NK07_HALGN|nr:hypothetical protein FGO68_gene12506 [Halteria grandinella]
MMATETFGISNIAKQDRLFRAVDQMISWLLMIFPTLQLYHFYNLQNVYTGFFHANKKWGCYYCWEGKLDKIYEMQYYALPFLVATDIFTPLIHTIKVYTYAFL